MKFERKIMFRGIPKRHTFGYSDAIKEYVERAKKSWISSRDMQKTRRPNKSP